MDEPRDTATTDATGVALLPRVVPGAHRVAVRSPVMTLLGTPPLELMVAVAGQQDEPSPLELPSERTLLARACGAPSAARREALLRGSLRTTALPVPDARVEAAWETRYVRLGGGAPVTVPRRVVATTDARGAFTMCGLPRGVPITLRAVRGRSDERATTMTIPAQAVAVEERVVVEP